MILDIVLRTMTSFPSESPQVDVDLPQELKILGGGALVEQSGVGNLLTACFPVTPRKWRARAKDHEMASQATITAYAFALNDPHNDYEVFIQAKTSDLAHHPKAIAQLPAGFVLTGGGASVDSSGAGSLLTASFPNSDGSWEARSKDHDIPDPARITAYVIGIKPNKPNAPPVRHVIRQFTGSISSTPVATVSLDDPHKPPSPFQLCGGGAFDQWSGAGNLLTSSFPSIPTERSRSWTATGKDHIHLSPAAIEVFAVGVTR